MIYLIITSSIINKLNYPKEDRELRYKESIRQTLSLLPGCIHPIIVENNGKRNTFLDDFNIPVHYTNSNKLSCFSKGGNEMLDVHAVIKEFNIQDDDIVIKLTGRYSVSNNEFFQFVLNNQDKYDSFVKFYNVSTKQFMDNDCVLGLFAMRCKYLRQFRFTNIYQSPEVQFAQYARSNGRVYKCDHLNLKCVFAIDLTTLIV